MLTSDKQLVVLGASGFVGREVTRRAVEIGWHVRALARSESSAKSVAAIGATPFAGDAEDPASWIGEVRGAHAIVDLLQPAVPKRLGRGKLRGIALQRKRFTVKLLRAIESLPLVERPMLVSVSGVDDLAPDATGRLSSESSLRSDDYGFNPIGIPVRRAIEASGIVAAFAYLGTVYGPGKGFAETIFPSIAAGTWKNFGRPSDMMALVHVEDAARGLIHVATTDAATVAGRTFVLTDGRPPEQNAFFDLAAKLIGARAPGRVPRWLAAIFAGRPLVEATTCNVPIAFAPENFPADGLVFPSYRDGLPGTLTKLGYTVVP